MFMVRVCQVGHKGMVVLFSRDQRSGRVVRMVSFFSGSLTIKMKESNSLT